MNKRINAKRSEAIKLGLKTYNTGKPCVYHPENIGGCERYVSNNFCIEHTTDYYAIYRQENKETERAYCTWWCSSPIF